MIEINGKIYRNIQEQVAKNQDDIEDLQESMPDMSKYYTKTQTNGLLDLKADKSTTYTKTEDNELLALKADKSTTYTKTEVDTLIEGVEGTAVVVITGNSSSGILTQDEYDLLFNSNVSFIKFNTTMYYRDWSADATTPTMEFKTIPYVSTTIPNYKFEQKHITVNSDRTWTHATIRKNYAKEDIGIINMGSDTNTSGTFTSTQLSYLTQNTVSLIIKNNLYYYRTGSSYNLYIYRSLPETATNTDGTTTQTYKMFTVNTTSGEWWDYTRSFTAELPVQEFAVYFEFNKSGTGAGYYSVYFNLKAKRTKYASSNLSFGQLRDLIIANGNHVECTCQTSAGTLYMNMISTSTNAGDNTILVDSKSGDFFEFYSYNDLTNYSITELTY